MYIDLILWDDADDPQGNVQHILGPGEVTPEEGKSSTITRVRSTRVTHRADRSSSAGRPQAITSP